MDSLTERRIRLRRNAAVSADAVAELAAAGLFVLCRQMVLGYCGLLDGRYSMRSLLGKSTARQRAAVWGAGPVGRAVFGQLVAIGALSTYVRHSSLVGGAPVSLRPEPIQP
ncbi:MAG: hypothetical protein ACP5O0_11165 [Acidimicrobiales bacterium]